MLCDCKYKTIEEVINGGAQLPKSAKKLLHKYTKTDNANSTVKFAL